jgi:hypothetical protein
MTPLEAIMKMKAAFEAAGLQFAPGESMPAPEAMPEAAPAAVPTEAAKEYDLVSGGKVKIDSLEVGGYVTILDEAGNEAPAPAGDHELVDGTTITVDEAGIITAINAPVEEAPEVEVEIESSVEPSETEMKIAKLEKDIEELKKEALSKKQMMSEVEAKFSKAISEMSDVIVGLINTPSASATENPKDKFNAHVESREDKMKRFLDRAKNINK